MHQNQSSRHYPGSCPTAAATWARAAPALSAKSRCLRSPSQTRTTRQSCWKCSAEQTGSAGAAVPATTEASMACLVAVAGPSLAPLLFSSLLFSPLLPSTVLSPTSPSQESFSLERSRLSVSLQRLATRHRAIPMLVESCGGREMCSIVALGGGRGSGSGGRERVAGKRGRGGGACALSEDTLFALRGGERGRERESGCRERVAGSLSHPPSLQHYWFSSITTMGGFIV